MPTWSILVLGHPAAPCPQRAKHPPRRSPPTSGRHSAMVRSIDADSRHGRGCGSAPAAVAPALSAATPPPAAMPLPLTGLPLPVSAAVPAATAPSTGAEPTSALSPCPGSQVGATAAHAGGGAAQGGDSGSWAGQGCQATEWTQSSWPSSSASSEATSWRPPAAKLSLGAYLRHCWLETV